MRTQRGWSLRAWIAIGLGTAATWGMAAVGMAALQRSLGADRETWQYFFDARRMEAPIEATEFFFGLPPAGHEGVPQVAAEFLSLLADQGAEEKLERLVFEGASGSRVYGLCGLRILGAHRPGLDSWFVAQRDGRRVAVTQGGTVSVSTPHDLVGSPAFDVMCDRWKEAHLASVRSRPTH